MKRSTWRNIFIGIIVLTIPCYLFGIFIWYANDGSLLSEPTATLTPSRTPINVTELALTDPSLIVTQIPLTSTPTTSFDLGLTPLIPTRNIIATQFFTSTPTATLFVPNTNTPAPQLTATPTETQMILMPPTDTPSP